MRPGHPKYIRSCCVRCHFGSRSFAKRSLVGSSRASKLCSVTQSSGRIRRVAYRHSFSVFPISLGRHSPHPSGPLPSSWSRDSLLLCVACFVVFAALLASLVGACPESPRPLNSRLSRLVRVAQDPRLSAVVFRSVRNPENHYAVPTAVSGRSLSLWAVVGVSTPKLPSSRPCRS